MKYHQLKLISISAFFLFVSLLAAQSNPDLALGKIIYLEGKVQINNEQEATPAQIGTLIFDETRITTFTGSVAEIQWNNGTRSLVEAQSSYKIKELYPKSNLKTLEQNESTFSGFKKLFRAAAESKRSVEAGVRRSKAIVDTSTHPETLDWIEEPEVSFEEAAAYYEKGDYARAISAFKSFLEQQPLHEMTKYATFALGHSYLMANNLKKAKEVFEKFKLQYSNEDELYQQVERLLKDM